MGGFNSAGEAAALHNGIKFTIVIVAILVAQLRSFAMISYLSFFGQLCVWTSLIAIFAMGGTDFIPAGEIRQFNMPKVPMVFGVIAFLFCVQAVIPGLDAEAGH